MWHSYTSCEIYFLQTLSNCSVMNEYPELLLWCHWLVLGCLCFWIPFICSVHLPGRCSPFWQGHEGKFSVYVHASKTKPVHVSRYFVNRDIRSDQVHIVLLLFTLVSFMNCIISYVWVYVLLQKSYFKYVSFSFFVGLVNFEFWLLESRILLLTWEINLYYNYIMLEFWSIM
jgi:hypothetical protein